MSEYQYHEWQTVDRVLTPEEQAAVNDLSSHIEVSSSRAVVTYHWSNFRHDPKQVLRKYFDGYFYLANWGSLRLMFRFPKGLLDEDVIAPYCVEPFITFETAGRYQVLDLDFGEEDGEGWMEVEAGLSIFIRLRADLLEGDHRLLYLAWLKAATLSVGFEEADEDESGDGGFDREPPVPPGLGKLSPPLQNIVEVFGLDSFLVQAAAEASAPPAAPRAVDYRKGIDRLPPSERDDFLLRLAEGDPGVGLALRKRLGAFLPPAPGQVAKPRGLQQLLHRAQQLRREDEERRAEAARKQHVAEMEALAHREAQAWEQVEALLDKGRKIASVYDEATGTLAKLHQLAEYRRREAGFRSRLRDLAKKYASRPSLIDRWKKRGWI